MKACLSQQAFDGFLVECEGPRSKSNQRQWVCICRCLRPFLATTAYIRSGRCQSCGCLSFTGNNGNIKQDPQQTTWNVLLNSYKQRAKRDCIEWRLTDSEAASLFSSRCHYCGVMPTNRINAFVTKAGRYLSKNKTRANLGWVAFNGIDRKNSDVGYLVDNCVGCCSVCNYAKGKLSQDDFEAWIDRLCEYKSRKTE